MNSRFLFSVCFLFVIFFTASSYAQTQEEACPLGVSSSPNLEGTYYGDTSYIPSQCPNYNSNPNRTYFLTSLQCWSIPNDACPQPPDPDPDPDPSCEDTLEGCTPPPSCEDTLDGCPPPPSCNGDDLYDAGTSQCCPLDASQSCYSPDPNSGGGDPNGGGGDPDPDNGTGDGGTGDGGTGDGGTGDNGTGGGGTGDGGTGDGGTGDGGTGDSGTGDSGTAPSGSNTGACDSSESCRSLAAQSCTEPRDKLFFTYISGSSYFAECDTCGGTASASYSECSQCAYGYNPNTNSCYPVTCAHGDCSTPNDGNTLPDHSGDSTEVVAAIRDLQADINSGVKVTNLIEITNSLDDLSSDLQAKIGTKSDDIVDSIESLKTHLDAITQAINDKEIGGGGGGDTGTGPNTTETNDQCVADEAGNLPSFCTNCEADANGNFPKGCSETELKKILKDILKVQQEAACLLGSTNEDNGCPAPEDNTEEFDHGAAATGLYTAIQGSEFISSLTGVKDAFAGVSSSCNYNYSLHIPYANTDVEVDICGWLEPIANLLRGFFIAFWAMAGIRHIFSA
ncbi:hypothetical protein [Thalassolituus oleivorans]|uniref:hypothetical protein n=1 Tax=Thalassolituus oleivorans TaxID=187493 RepID=UPI0023F24C74|nr:hypothetical protein [Thalassolituus oleivorans]